MKTAAGTSLSALPDKDALEELLVSRGVAGPVLLQLLIQTVLQNICAVSTIKLSDLNTSMHKNRGEKT